MTLGAATRRDFGAHLLAWLGSLASVYASACQPAISSSSKVIEPSSQHEPLQLEPLTDLAIGAGLQWIVVASPQDLARHKVLSQSFARFIPPTRRHIFHRLTGIDLDAMQRLVVAGYERSVLFLMNGMFDPRATEEVFHNRFLQNGSRKVYRPDAVWSHGIVAGNEVRAIAALSPNVIAVEGGQAFRSKIALLLALGRLHRSPRAFDLPDMKRVYGELGDGVGACPGPGPFEGDWQKALGGMLGVTSVIGARVRLLDDGQMNLAIRLAGSWQGDEKRAAAILLDRYGDMTNSSIGKLLHLHEPTLEPSPFERPDLVGVDVQLDGIRCLGGLYDVIAADLGDMLSLGRATDRIDDASMRDSDEDLHTHG